MPKYWMINDRSQGGVGPDVNFDGVTYWVSDKQPLTDIKNWRQVTGFNFQKLLEIEPSDLTPILDVCQRLLVADPVCNAIEIDVRSDATLAPIIDHPILRHVIERLG